ncbi:hypothetical protein PHLCEN_2v303 [Hermanssonia centrifuga]|uniref:Uncharacterized protein n=1 Tax=Hermanssonia centrifuga TaxID=98765 RepID=A0A2R6S6E7_9APHY|nr:hypothetical protein PHLCEN_2v303 [Hermanssonia centrifuga]
MAIKVAGFYHLIGLQEKMEALKDDREDADRLLVAREKRRERTRDLAAIPAPRAPAIPEPSRRKPFQDFHPPPAIRRPGLDRATPAPAPVKPVVPNRFQVPEPPSFVDDSDDFQSSAADWSTEYSSQTQDGKRKRSVDRDVVPLVENNGVKRRAMEEMPDSRTPQTKSNPFARKPGADNNRNPFARGGETNKPVQKSESFFVKVDAAETEKTKRSSAAKGKGKERKETGRQTTLFGFSGAPLTAEKKGAGKKKLNEDSQTTATSSTEETQQETQDTDVTMDESQDRTQLDEEPSQVPTEIDEFASGQDLEVSISFRPISLGREELTWDSRVVQNP